MNIIKYTEALLKKVTVADFPLKLRYLLNIARAYYPFKENEKVVSILQEVANSESSLNDSYDGMPISNLIGLSYRNLGKLNESTRYFENALQKAIKIKDTIWIGICNGNIGENYFLEGQLEKNATPANAQNTTAIEQLEQSAILTDKDWREFKSVFEQVHAGFIERLKQQYPKLTPSEIRYDTLSRLNLSTNEMALVQGVSLGTIRQVKRRFLKSSDLQNKEVLTDFITNL